jgi:hypothetical protein
MLVTLSTKTDIGVTLAISPMMASERAMATMPTTIGSRAATRAPKAGPGWRGRLKHPELEPAAVVRAYGPDVELEGARPSPVSTFPGGKPAH